MVSQSRGSLVERAAEKLNRSGHESEIGGTIGAHLAGAAQSDSANPLDRPQPPSQSEAKHAMIDFRRLRRTGFLTPNAERNRTMEEFRLIKHALLRNISDRRQEGSKNSNLVMVTGAVPGEGKTFTAVNLALRIASEKNQTVLLIDADLTRPDVVKTLGIDEADKGLIEVLEDPTCDLGDVLVRTNMDGLVVVAAGQPNGTSTELLTSKRMEQIVTEMARRYSDRIVIFDSPPVLSTSEATALAAHVGQIVFVVEADMTPETSVRQALELVDIGAQIGLVLNRSRPQFGASEFGSYYKTYA